MSLSMLPYLAANSTCGDSSTSDSLPYMQWKTNKNILSKKKRMK